MSFRSLHILALTALACGARSAAQQRSILLADSAFLPKGIAASELPDPESRGALLVARYCSSCHGIPSPASHGADDWTPTVRRMLMHLERGEHMPGMRSMMQRGMRMGMRMRRATVPTDEERRTLLAYLQAHALRTIAADSVPARGTAGAGVFAHACDRCHALPSPTQHTATEWPAVVTRMREHMRGFMVDTISDNTAAEVIDYLERAAGRRAPESPER